MSIFVSCSLFSLEGYFVLIWVSLSLLYFGCYLLGVSLWFEPMFIFRTEMSLLEAAYSWIFLIHPATLHVLIGEFRPFTFCVIIDRWRISTVILFCFLTVLYLHFFFLLLFLSAISVWYFSVIFFSVYSFFVCVFLVTMKSL